MKKTLAFVGAFFLMVGVAHADPETLILNGPLVNGIQQTDNNPCIIGGSCGQNGGLDYTQLNGSSVYPQTSPTYTVSQIRAIAGDYVDIAVDVNTANQPSPGFATEELEFFQVWIGGSLAYQYLGGTAKLPLNEQGNGYADLYLQTISLQGLSASTPIYFVAKIVNQTDGFETFFLATGVCRVNCEITEVPEPGTLALLGAGLAGLALIRRRRRT